MTAVIVRYRTKVHRAEENQRLVEKVFAELDEMHATGFGYASFRLDDGVSFLHVVVEDEGGGSVSLADVPAFREFQAGIADRCAEQPVAMAATVVVIPASSGAREADRRQSNVLGPRRGIHMCVVFAVRCGRPWQFGSWRRHASDCASRRPVCASIRSVLRGSRPRRRCWES